MKKEIVGAISALAAAIAAIASFPAQAAAGWEISEDGKHWMYYDDWDEPVMDEWIEVGGKTYYLDTKGYMKTGWVTDKESGGKYYMGEDGAMCYNIFAPDGRYVGHDGGQVETYDKYRKAVKSQAAKAAKKTSKTSKSDRSQDQAGTQVQPYFVLTDLNRDGYRDLVVMEGPVEAAGGFFGYTGDVASGVQGAGNGGLDPWSLGGCLLEVAVWDAEEEGFQLAAEFDASDKEQHSTLYVDPGEGGVWLEIADENGDLRLFQMEYETSVFENVWSFTMDLDDWGGAAYYINGDEEDKDIWEQYMAQAKIKRGNTPVTGYLPVTDDNLSAQVDRLLTEEEWKRMW